MRILVTGGAGFIGGNLVNRLVSMGAGEVLVLDNLYRGFSRDSLPGGVEFRRADIRDLDALADALKGREIVFHLAAQSNVMGAVADAGYSFSTNVVGTSNVLQSAAAAGVKRLVFPSSREVYGDPRSLPVPETAPFLCVPKTLMARAKSPAKFTAGWPRNRGSKPWSCGFPTCMDGAIETV